MRELPVLIGRKDNQVVFEIEGRWAQDDAVFDGFDWAAFDALTVQVYGHEMPTGTNVTVVTPKDTFTVRGPLTFVNA